MDHIITISAEEIAREMRSNPEFGMDVLANFASDLDTADFAEEGAVSQFHEDAAPVLKRLANDIVEALNE